MVEAKWSSDTVASNVQPSGYQEIDLNQADLVSISCRRMKVVLPRGNAVCTGQCGTQDESGGRANTLFHFAPAPYLLCAIMLSS